MVLHGTWNKAHVLSLQNYFPGCKWIQMSVLELESVIIIFWKLAKFFQR